MIQCMAMGPRIHLVAVFAILVAQAVHGLHFPRGKTLVYKYYGDVKATFENGTYASQFALEATVRVHHETSDPTLTNAYYIALSDLKTGMHNGAATFEHRIDVLNPIDEAARALQQPFLIIYDRTGLLQGVKILEDEPGWSKNMKLAMASLLQLDFTNIDVANSQNRTSSITTENTIYGDCSFPYDVYARGGDASKPKFVVVKVFSPKNCTGFEVYSSNQVDSCLPIKEKPINLNNKRILDIEFEGEEVTITKIFAHGGVDYLPPNKGAKPHYLLTNATFDLEGLVLGSETNLPLVDFRNVPIIRNVTYREPQGTYAPDSAVDLTNGRHVVNFDAIVTEVRQMIEEAVDYVEENHLKAEAPDSKRGQTINRIVQAMSYMDSTTLERVYNYYLSRMVPRNSLIRSFLRNVIPKVGTPATSVLAMNLIRRDEFSGDLAIAMLRSLPLNVRTPTEELLVQLERFLTLEEYVQLSVRKASILAFSSLMHRTFEGLKHPEENTLLQRYLRHFFERVKTEPTYEMKVVYLMAIRNVQVGKIYDLLSPIIKGDLTISEKPLNIRLLAIWAVEKAIEKDNHVAEELLWPTMTDSSLPIKLRIAAYDILIRIPNELLLGRIDGFIAAENNEHLSNYHYTTVQNIMDSEEPCNRPLRKLIVKAICEDTRQKDSSYTLSGSYSLEQYSMLIDLSRNLHGRFVLNERTGVPEVVQLYYMEATRAGGLTTSGIRLHVQGLDKLINQRTLGDLGNRVTNQKVVEVLMRAARDLPPAAEFSADIVVMSNGFVTLANHCNEQTLYKMLIDFVPYLFGQLRDDPIAPSYQNLEFDNFAQKHVISDMGLPLIIESRMPTLTTFNTVFKTVSLKSDPCQSQTNCTDDEESTMSNLEVSLELKLWKHGEHSLAGYNPVADAWHAIRRSTAIDISLLLRLTLGYDPFANKLKISFPRPSSTELPLAGYRYYLKDFVSVETGDGGEALKKSCSTCNLQENVDNGSGDKINFDNHKASTVAGLNLSLSVFDCQFDDYFNPYMPFDLFDIKRENNEIYSSMVLYPPVTSCGLLLKVEPSQVYPTASINFMLGMDHVGDDSENPSYYILKREKYNAFGNVEVISGAANTSVMSLGFKLKVDMSDGHLLNAVKLQLSSKVEGEKSFKICLSAQKSYPAVPLDTLKLGTTKEETHSIFTIAAGSTDDNTCGRNSTLLTVTIKGELSDEQKRKLAENYLTGLCRNDIANPLYGKSKKVVPTTLSCLNEAITYTTLRKYTINVAHVQIPSEVIPAVIRFHNEKIRPAVLPDIRLNIEDHNEENLKISAVFPMLTDATDSHSDSEIANESFGNGLTHSNEVYDRVTEPFWIDFLDNTRFNYQFLSDYTDGTIKMCVVYPRITLTADEKSIPFTVPHEWTLVTGDHSTKYFAIFVKSVGDNLAAKLYTASHEVEISPSSNSSVRVVVGGQEVSNPLADSLTVRNNDESPVLTIARMNQRIYVQFESEPSLSMVYSLDHVTLTIESELYRGRVSGLCGHLDDTYRNDISEFFILA